MTSPPPPQLLWWRRPCIIYAMYLNVSCLLLHVVFGVLQLLEVSALEGMHHLRVLHPLIIQKERFIFKTIILGGLEMVCVMCVSSFTNKRFSGSSNYKRGGRAAPPPPTPIC